MHERTTKLGRGLVVALALAWPAAAMAEITLPDCSMLSVWVTKFDARARTPLSATNASLWLHGLLLDGETARLFGRPALEWSADDVGAADKALAACAAQARRDGPSRAAEARLADGFRNSALKQLGDVLRTVGPSNQRIDDALRALLALPPSTDALRALAALAKAAEGPTGMVAANAALAVLPNEPPREAAAALWVALRDGLASKADRVYPVLAARHAELRPTLIAQSIAAFDALPPSLDGRDALDAQWARSKGVLRSALPAEDLAAIEAAMLARRDAIEDNVLAEERARILATPPGPAGLAALAAIRSGPASGLSRARVQQLKQRADAREADILVAMVDDRIAALEGFPASLAGLREIEAYRGETVGIFEHMDETADHPRYSSRFVRAWIARKGTLSGQLVDQEIARVEGLEPNTLAEYGDKTAPAILAAVGVQDAERLIAAVNARAALQGIASFGGAIPSPKP